MLFRQLMLLVS